MSPSSNNQLSCNLESFIVLSTTQASDVRSEQGTVGLRRSVQFDLRRRVTDECVLGVFEVGQNIHHS